MARRAGQAGLPDLGPRGEGWVVGQFLILGLLVAVGLPGLADLRPHIFVDWLALGAGAAALAAAGWVALAAFRELGRNLTPFPRPREDAALVAIYLDLKSRREEAWLDERYAGYGAYRERTKRFVPRVY